MAVPMLTTNPQESPKEKLDGSKTLEILETGVNKTETLDVMAWRNLKDFSSEGTWESCE